MTPDPGALALSILRILSASPRSLADVQAAIGNHAGNIVAATVERLRADGLVWMRWKRLELTREGRGTAVCRAVARAARRLRAAASRAPAGLVYEPHSVAGGRAAVLQGGVTCTRNWTRPS